MSIIALDSRGRGFASQLDAPKLHFSQQVPVGSYKYLDPRDFPPSELQTINMSNNNIH